MSYSEANVRLCRYAVHFRALPSGLVSDVPPMWAQDDQREVRSSAEQLEESTHLPASSRPHTCHYVVRLPSSDPDRAVSGFARIPRLMQFPWPAWLIGIRCSSPAKCNPQGIYMWFSLWVPVLTYSASTYSLPACGHA